MNTLTLHAPLAGWALSLPDVPDPVFAQGMAGDGVAIDPTGDTLHAPCAGEIVLMHNARHALTLRTPQGCDILMHVGIDTVQLHGEGFELLVQQGEKVRTGQALLRFDLDRVARSVPSLITPVLLTAGGTVLRRTEGVPVNVGDFLMEIVTTEAATQAPAGGHDEVRRTLRVSFEHGLHARPAAQVAAALRPYTASVTLQARGGTGNARSTTSIMSLGVRCGETIEAIATGPDAQSALAALESLLGASTPHDDDHTPTDAAPSRSRYLRSDCIAAVVASRGLASGVAARLHAAEYTVSEAGTDIAHETSALARATELVRDHLESLMGRAGDAQKTILAAHAEMIRDPDLAARAHDWLRQGKSAGYAWRQATQATVSILAALGDAYMMERASDLRDLEQQVLVALSGKSPAQADQLPPRAILIADELLPSQLIALDPARLAGVCTARGGPTSHVAILCGAMGLPALAAAGADVLEIPEGTALLLDAEQGQLLVEPSAEYSERFERTLAARSREREADLAAAHLPCVTRDGVHISVYANLGALAETPAAVEQGAEGCGLLRTEFLFLDRRDPPDEAEQRAQYQAIADALGGRPLTVRTLDIGGDKPIPYLPLPHEENPALGLRGLRTSLWRPELLRTQLRAILQVQPVHACRILLPMVTDVEDVRTVRTLIEELRDELGLATAPALGVMIETPASALMADQLARVVDFLSIGSNDLSQYTLAMDRTHPELAARLDALHPAVLRLIATAARAGEPAHLEVAVCGGLASDLAAIPILIGLGVREISCLPSLIPRIKSSTRTLDCGACAELARVALEQQSATAVRALVQRWLENAQGRDVPAAVAGG